MLLPGAQIGRGWEGLVLPKEPRMAPFLAPFPVGCEPWAW
jgi:hypothetical protein